MKILLVQPPVSGITVKNRIIEPLALEILAATVINEHEVRIVDLRIENKFKEVMLDFTPDVVGFTCYISQVDIVKNLARKAKELNPYVVTVVGGEQPTCVPEDFNIPEINYISRGDGERAFPKLISYIKNSGDTLEIAGIIKVENGKLVFGADKEILNDMTESPIPARELTSRYRSFYKFLGWNAVGSLATSRGCKYKCNFCSIWKIRNGITAQFPIPRVIEELKLMKENNIYFCEAHSFQDVPYMERLANEIVINEINKKYMMYVRVNTVVQNPGLFKKWYDIGLRRVFIGFESITDHRLKNLNKASNILLNENTIKILHNIGIEIVASFIIDLDFTEEDFNILREWVLEMELTMPVYNILTPLPGNELFDKNKDILKKIQYDYFDFNHALLPTRLPKKTFYRSIAKLYRDTYSNKISKETLDRLGYNEQMFISRTKVGQMLATNLDLICEHEG